MHSLLRFPPRSVYHRSGSSSPASSTHRGRGRFTVSLTFPPHAWNAMTTCRRSPARRTCSSSCRYGAQSYSPGERSTAPHHTSTITPLHPAALRLLSACSNHLCEAYRSSPVWSTQSSGSMTVTGTPPLARHRSAERARALRIASSVDVVRASAPTARAGEKLSDAPLAADWLDSTRHCSPSGACHSHLGARSASLEEEDAEAEHAVLYLLLFFPTR
mmetsp:Transcript_8149/g.21019  ORF Transcript_8149/g.21019 Transcript_8149/m.21019 type:complete len:217 (+) Transcript_8149:1263-1913(+)